MIEKVRTRKALKNWIKFTKKIYKKEEFFVPPLYRILTKELNQEVLVKRNYTAITCIKNNEPVGRILYTFKFDNKLNTKVCYFSYLESIDDFTVFQELFNYVEEEMVLNDCKILEGSYTPYDPDNRRGILVEGFEYPPMIFTSYNKSYYGPYLEQLGFIKAYDTLALWADIEYNKPRLATLDKFVRRHLPSFHTEFFNRKNYHKQLKDIAEIMSYATTDVNFTAAPSVDFLEEFVKNYGFFLRNEYITIGYDGDRPVCFAAILPNFNELFKKLNGRMNYITLFFNRRKIYSCRGFLQYAIPEYQDKGVIASIYNELSGQMLRFHNETFEGSTILENNLKSVNLVKTFENSRIYKRYRIYRKDVQA